MISASIWCKKLMISKHRSPLILQSTLIQRYICYSSHSAMDPFWDDGPVLCPSCDCQCSSACTFPAQEDDDDGVFAFLYLFYNGFYSCSTTSIPAEIQTGRLDSPRDIP